MLQLGWRSVPAKSQNPVHQRRAIVEGFQITKTPTLMVYLEGQEARNAHGGCDEATMKAFINEIIYELEQAAKKT